MYSSKSIAKHIRGVYFGPNWSDNNLKMHLTQVNWLQSLQKLEDLNSIASLAFHVNYYVVGVSKVLDGGALEIRDKYSFDHPPINSQEDWEQFLDQMWKDGERFALLIEQLAEDKLWEDFTDKKYGNYHTNLLGILEHLHYHLGQIVIIRKLLSKKEQ